MTPLATSEPRFGVLIARDVMVPMRDGVRLATDVWRPAIDGEPAPGRFPGDRDPDPVRQDTSGPMASRRRGVLRSSWVRGRRTGLPRSLQQRGHRAVSPRRNADGGRGRVRHCRVGSRAALVYRQDRDERDLVWRPRPDPCSAVPAAASRRAVARRRAYEQLSPHGAHGWRDAAADVRRAVRSCPERAGDRRRRRGA